MIDKLIKMLGVSGMVNENTLKKGIEKIQPKFKKFFSESEKYGYPLGAAIGFLKSDLMEGNQPVDKSLRPDQAANIQLQRQAERPQQIGGAALKAGAGALTGGLGGAALAGLGGLLGGRGSAQQQSQLKPENIPPMPTNLFQNTTPMQKEAGVISKTQEEAVKQYNAMQKEKQLYKQLHEKYGEFYGGQQAQVTGAKSELAALTQQGLALLQQLNRGK